MKRPNIVLILADQMRGDCLGIMGHPDVQTPYLDSLAVEGALFENAYSACPSCIPARAALFTGMSQARHGRVGYLDGVDWDYPHMLAGELSNAGYYTQCVGKMHVHPLRRLCGFDHVELHDGYLGYYRKSTTPYYESQKVADDYFYWLKEQRGAAADVTDTGIECNSWVARPWIYDEMQHPTNWAVSRSIDFLRRRDRDQPFFLMTSFVRPHPPFDAPQCYFDLYAGRNLAPPAVGHWADNESYRTKGRFYCSADGIADETLQRQAQVGYYACITHLDHQIGRLLQALQEDGCYENTVIVFVSDHGEQLGDHHTFRKSLPYQGSVHVPLLLGGPALPDAARGVRQKQVVELRDIMPTLLAFAGAPVPESVEGRSLLDVLGTGEPLRDYLHGEHSYGEKSSHYIVTETEKYIWFSQSGREQYFDLRADPCECRDLIDSPDRARQVGRLRQALVHELSGRPEGYVENGRLVAGRESRVLL